MRETYTYYNTLSTALVIFDLLSALKRSGNMWNNQDIVSYLKAVCFVSAGLGFVLHYSVTTVQGHDASCKKYFVISLDHVQRYVYFYLLKRLLKMKASIGLKLGDCEHSQVVFVYFHNKSSRGWPFTNRGPLHPVCLHNFLLP